MKYSKTTNGISLTSDLIWFKVKSQKKSVWLLVGVIIISSVCSLLLPFYTALLIDNLKNNTFLGFGLAYLFVLVIKLVTSCLSTVIGGRLCQEVIYSLREVVFAKIQSMPVLFFVNNQSGQIIARVNNDTRKIDNFLSQYIFEFISSFFSFVLIGMFIFWVDLRIAILVWLLILFTGFVTLLLSKQTKKASYQKLETDGKLITFINENVSNYKAILALSGQSMINTEFTDLVEVVYTKTLKSKLLVGILRPFYNSLSLIAQICVVGFGVYLVGLNLVTIGTLISMLLYTQKLFEPLTRLSAVFGSLNQARGALARLDELLILNPDDQNPILHNSQDSFLDDNNQ
jgi:ATP-binding cassette, subfamily B, bacterial